LRGDALSLAPIGLHRFKFNGINQPYKKMTLVSAAEPPQTQGSPPQSYNNAKEDIAELESQIGMIVKQLKDKKKKK